MDITKHTVQSLLEGYKKKEFKPSEVAESYLTQIKKQNGKLNAFLQVKEEETRATAKKWDEKLSDVDKYPLFGIPLGVKDNFLVKGWQCTAGSKILGGYTSPYTSTSVERLEKAGAVVIGKLNCDEFAMGSSNENSAYGNVKNPWDLTRVPGGSSGGSSAAVAASLCPVSLGTDTGGSIRQPASLCGIVGIKPTYGRVSRYGIVSYASSLDQVGPFGRTVWDASRVLEVMSGYDQMDATSSKSSVPKYTNELTNASVKDMKIGVARAWLEGVDPEVKKSFEDSLDALKKSGATIVDVQLPNAKYSLSTYYLIAPSECSSNLARFDGVHYGYRSKNVKNIEELYSNSRGEGIGKEVKLRIMLGTYALSSGYYDAYYMKANQVRRLIQQDFEKAFEGCNCIAAPTSPTTAFKLGEKTDDPLTMYLSDIFTLPVNLAGIAGISVPCGLDGKGLPIGLQLIGKAFDETTLLKIARSFESIRGDFPLAKGLN